MGQIFIYNCEGLLIMMNYELFLALATQHKLGTLSQDRYEMLQRAPREVLYRKRKL